MSLAEILSRVMAFDCQLVEITGGEPLIQGATPRLIAQLIASGREVLLETNGSLDIDRVDRRCSRIMDVKCPSSGASAAFDRGNIERLSARDQVKFVIGDREDFQYAVGMLARLPDTLPRHQILFSAVSGRLAPARLARWLLNENIRARLQIQLHKTIWPGSERGV